MAENLSGKIVKTVNTAPAEGQPQQPTVLTVDFDGVTPEDAMAYMFSTVAIRMQSRWRSKKNGGIPKEATVKVADLVKGMRAAAPVTVDSTLAAIKALSPEQQKAIQEAMVTMAAQAKKDAHAKK